MAAAGEGRLIWLRRLWIGSCGLEKRKVTKKNENSEDKRMVKTPKMLKFAVETELDCRNRLLQYGFAGQANIGVNFHHYLLDDHYMNRIPLLITLLAGAVGLCSAADFQSGALYYNLLSDGNVEVAPSEADPYSGSVAVPSRVLYLGEQRDVSGIGSHAFASCADLTELFLPEGLGYIGEYACYDCRSLENVNLPSSLTVIADRAFAMCESLKEISLPQYVSCVGDNAFSCCYALTAIGDLPPYAKLGDGAFSYCIALERADLSGHSAEIGESLFRGCDMLREVIFNPLTREIPAYAFADCYNLLTLDLPDSLTEVGEWAFSGCTALKDLTLPRSLQLLHQRAFAGCTGIVAINFNSDAELTIGEGAFENLSALGYLYLDGVKSVGDRAFSGAGSLEWIEIDRKVEEIGSWAFTNCQLLDKVYAHSEWPARITINTFDTATEQRSTLYVFPEARERYAMAAYWNRFNAIEATSRFPLSVEIIEDGMACRAVDLIRGRCGGVIVDPMAGHTEVYDSTGALRCSGKPEEVSRQELESGIYIVRCSAGAVKVLI